jgi:hypothetical protein
MSPGIRLDAKYGDSIAAVFTRNECKCCATRSDPVAAELRAQRAGQPCDISDALAHFLVVFVTRRLYLDMPGQRLQRVVDHQIVHAELQPDHEDEQHVGKDHGTCRQPRAFRVPPQVAPSQPENEIHRISPVDCGGSTR